MDALSYWQFLWPLLFTLSLIGLVTLLLHRYGWFGVPGLRPAMEKKLRVQEILHLDYKKKLVLLNWENQEFLILLGQSHDLLLSQKPASHSGMKTDA